MATPILHAQLLRIVPTDCIAIAFSNRNTHGLHGPAITPIEGLSAMEIFQQYPNSNKICVVPPRPMRMLNLDRSQLPASKFPEHADVYICDRCGRDITSHHHRGRAHRLATTW